MYSLKIDTKVDESWNQNLLKSQSSTFFQTADYLSTDSKNFFPIFISVLDENNSVVGQLGFHIIRSTVLYSSSFFRKLLKTVQMITTRGIWVYGPIIHSSDKKTREYILQELLNAADKVSKRYDLVFLEGFSPPNDQQVDDNYRTIFEKNGYLVSEFVTYITDLTETMDDIWNNVSKKARGDVNRARRRDITSQELQTRDDLKAYLLLHQQWAQTKGLVVTDPFQEFDKIWNNLQSGHEKIFLAYKDGKLISALRIAIFNQIAYTHFVVSSYSEHTNLGGTLLTWSAIEWAKKAGLKYYDFSGGPREESSSESGEKNSLLFYKKKWGGNEILHYNFTKPYKKTTYSVFLLLFRAVKAYHTFKMHRFQKQKNSET